MAKKLLAALVVLALCAALAAPAAFAQGNTSTVNWDDFRITKQPQSEKSLYRSDHYSLTVAVNVPEGVEVTYQWYDAIVPIPGAQSDTLRIGPEGYQPALWNRDVDMRLYCEIIGVEKDGGDPPAEKTLRSNTARIVLRGTFLENLEALFAQPLLTAVLGSFAGILPSMFAPFLAPLAIPLFIVAAPVVGIYSFFETLVALIRVARMY